MNDAQSLGGKSAGPRVGFRVAVVTETFPPEINGVAMTVGRLLDGLLRRGHEIQLVRPRQHRGEVPRSAAHYAEFLVPGLPLPRYDGLRIGLPAERTLRRLWSGRRPDSGRVPEAIPQPCKLHLRAHAPVVCEP